MTFFLYCVDNVRLGLGIFYLLLNIYEAGGEVISALGDKPLHFRFHNPNQLEQALREAANIEMWDDQEREETGLSSKAGTPVWICRINLEK